jgi:hypothetical protein
MWRVVRLWSDNGFKKGDYKNSEIRCGLIKATLMSVIALLGAISACSKESAGPVQCDQGLYACGNECANFTADVYHCGSCENVCPKTYVCSLGSCKTACDQGLKNCSDNCVPENNPCTVPIGASGSGGGTGGFASAGTSITGSVAKAGVAGMTGGSSGSGGATSTDSAAKPNGGYITSGGWHGYAWAATSATGATIAPKSFSGSIDFPLCASGSVESGYDNLAMVGWNLNQANTTGAATETVTPKQKGITVGVTNKGGSTLRIQIQGPNGATDATDRWCAVVPGTGGFIAYEAFNTECWAGGEGTAYAGQPIVAAIVLVPGTNTGSVSFDFCVTKMAETDEAGTGTVSTGCSLSGAPGEGSGAISNNETRTVTKDSRQYVVQNNVWNGNASLQSLSVNGVSFNVETQSNSSGTNGAPTSYPSVFIGSNFGHVTSGSNLPKQVSAIKSVQTGWKWTSASGTYNATYDVWFSTNAGGDSGTPSGAYLMVWYDRSSSVVPLGSQAGTERISGKDWQVWKGIQNGVPVISYIPTSGNIPEWSYDLNLFIKNSTEIYGVVKSTWYLTNVFAGFEIWNGGVGLKTENFCAIVE